VRRAPWLLTEAKKQAAAALALTNGRDVQFMAAAAFAFAGDTAKAESLAEGLNKRIPKDSISNFIYLPVIRGQIALDRRDPAKAISLLKPELTYDLGATGQGSVTPALYPVFVRAGAYLHAAQGKEAAAEYQKIIDNRGAVGNGPIGALAPLGLGRAYALEAQSLQGAAADEARAKARTAYQDFLALWKDADPDIPILIAAKSEYGKLQ
jgi:eukaryotic-like serine/threonine-protein kinase